LLKYIVTLKYVTKVRFNFFFKSFSIKNDKFL